MSSKLPVSLQSSHPDWPYGSLCKIVEKHYGGVPKDASAFYIYVPSAYLSEAYDELVTGDKIRGEILEVEWKEKFPELKGKTVDLIYQKGAVHDRLYISKKDWEENFREYGLVESGYKIELRLNEAILTGESVKLYSKRDIKI